MDYFSGDDDDNNSKEEEEEEEEEEETNQNDIPDPYEEPEPEEGKIKLKKKTYDEDDDEDDFEEDDYENDDNDDDYVDDDEEEQDEMNSSLRYGGGGGGGTNTLNLESSLQNNNEDNDEDEDRISENYLQKFDIEINKDYIVDFHPECFVHNYEEINTLTQIVRDVNYNIIDPLHKTIPFLTKYEKARIIGIRAKQINSGAKPFVQVPENIIDGYLIAEMELKEKRVPFIIKRPLPGGTCEYWKIKDLETVGF
jgi:DNA-directed RNA polymerase I, II, and III subunit RPABC2